MKTVFLYSLFFIFIISFIYGNKTIQASNNAIKIWLYTLLPSFIFPLIMVRILTPYHLIYKLIYPLKRVIKHIFHMDLYTFEIIICSLFLGFPSASIYLKEVLPEKINKKYLYIVFMASPNFILLSLHKLYDKKILLLIFISQLLTILIMLIFHHDNTDIIYKNKKTVFTIQLNKAINETFTILFMILAYLVIINVFIEIISIFIPQNMVAPFAILSEFSNGCFYLYDLNIPLVYKIFLTNLLLSYGGLCVHLQIISIIKEKFSYKTFLYYRIKQMVISSVILLLLMYRHDLM